MSTSIQRLRTASGIPVYYECLPHLRSATVGVWVRVGSRYERQDHFGVSHLVEHMLFKGTELRKARKIAEGLDHVGGELNAFTSREYSCYYARVAAEHFPLAMDLLEDIVFHSIFPEKEFAKEKKVVLEEVKMYEDSPEELAHDLLTSHMFDAHLGHPIVGERAIIEGVSCANVKDYWRKMYTPANFLISVAGNVPAKTLEKGLAYFDRRKGPRGRKTRPPRKANFTVGRAYEKKTIEQLHLVLGFPGVAATDSSRYALHLVSEFLGGGMSSQLFQVIREKHALAYNVYSFLQSYRDTGAFGIYCATDPTKVALVLKLVRRELQSLCRKGISARRLKRLKDQMRGSLTLNLERPNFRMTRMGLNQLVFGRILDIDEILDNIEGIDTGQIRDLACQVFEEGKPAVAGVSPLSSDEFFSCLAG